MSGNAQARSRRKGSELSGERDQLEEKNEVRQDIGKKRSVSQAAKNVLPVQFRTLNEHQLSDNAERSS
jgi:hypothetical protein